MTVTAVSDFYTVGSDATIVIAAGQTANATDTAAIAAADDDVDNIGDRTVTVTGTASNAQGVGAVTGASLTLTDDEGAPTATLALSSSSISESGGVATVTASLNHASSAAVTLTVSATGAGFTLSTAKTLTVASGQTASAGTVTVAAVADTTDGPDKSVTVSATASGGGVSDPASKTLTITDDDAAPTVTLALASSSIPENGGTTTVTATLSHPSSAATTVTVTAVSDFYTVGSDATVVIAAGSTSNATDTATVAAADDAIDNIVNRAVTVTGTASNDQGVGAVTGASLTLTDDEGAPTATLVLSSSSISESGGVATVTATLSGESSAAVTLTVGAAPGADTVAGDFTLSSPATLTVAAGETASTGTATVTAVDDTTDGPDKSVTVSATASGGGMADPASVTLTITDDDGTISPPDALRAYAGEDRTVDEGDAVTLDGGGSSGPAGLSYAWTQTAGTPTVSLTGANTDRPSFTAPEVPGITVLTFRLTVTAGGASASDTVDIRVNNVAHSDTDTVPTFGDATIPDQAWTRNTAISVLILPTATGGDGELAYSLSPALPAGVARAADTREVAGTPTVAMDETVYTWTATDEDGDEATLAFRISVAEDRGPAFDPDTFAAQVYVRGREVAPVVLPAATGGDGALAYRLTPELPAGLSFDETLRTISGTPTAAADEARYTLTATDEDGDEATLTFTIAVWMPITLTLENAEAVTEGEEAVFFVRLAPPPPGAMTLTYVTIPGSASAGVDYTHTAGRSLTVAAGQAEVKITVPTIDDMAVEIDEMFSLSVTGDAVAALGSTTAVGTAIQRVTATGTILDDERARGRALEAVLASFGRTVASQAVATIADRFVDGAVGTRVTLAGQELSFDRAAPVAAGAGRDARGPAAGRADREMTTRELISESSFALSWGAPDDTEPDLWTVWGQAGTDRSSGRPENDLEIGGDVFTGFLGVETRTHPDLLIGVALARSQGDMNYRLAGEQGLVDATLTSMFPYGHWTPVEGLGLWAMAGAGWGEAKLEDEAGRARTEIGMRMAATGWRKELGAAGDLSWALKGDGFAVEMESDAAEGLPATKAKAQRLRLIVEGTAEWPLTDSARLRTQLELGGRWDGGSIDRGYGTELSGGVAYLDTEQGIEGEVRGRYLLAHQSDGFEDRGASLTLRFDPGGDGLGTWVALSPQWGTPESGVESLWGGAPSTSGSGATRLGMEVGYRFDESLSVGLSFDRGAEEGARDYGLAGSVGMLGGAADLSLAAGRRESGTSATEHHIGLEY